MMVPTHSRCQTDDGSHTNMVGLLLICMLVSCVVRLQPSSRPLHRGDIWLEALCSLLQLAAALLHAGGAKLVRHSQFIRD